MFYVPELNLKGKGPLSRSPISYLCFQKYIDIDLLQFHRLWQASHTSKNVNRKVATDFKYEGYIMLLDRSS